MYVLLVENDNLDQDVSLFSSLENQGYQVCLVHTPESASQKVTMLWPNLVVFNPAQGPMDLFEFQEAIGQTNLKVPYIIVANKSHTSNKNGIEATWVAPDKLQQLSQSIKKATAKQKGRFLRLPGLTIDCEQLNVRHNDQTYSLTPKEFKLLYLLISNHDQVLSRKKIMQHVWETDYMGDTRTLDVHVRWLREKIEEKPSSPRRLITIRGLGYRFMTVFETE